MIHLIRKNNSCLKCVTTAQILTQTMDAQIEKHPTAFKGPGLFCSTNKVTESQNLESKAPEGSEREEEDSDPAVIQKVDHERHLPPF